MLAPAADLVLLYVTCPSHEVAEALAAPLVEEGLVACANLLPGLTALYRWQGALQRDTECLLLLKTLRERSDEVATRLRAAHPYETPCILLLPVDAGLPDYLDWLRASVLPPALRSK